MLLANDGSWLFVGVHKCASKSMYTALRPLSTIAGNWGDAAPERLAPVHFAICRDPYERAKSIYYQLLLQGDDQVLKQRMADAGYDWQRVDEAIAFIEQYSEKHPLFRTQSHYDSAGIVDVWVPLNNLQAGVEAIVGPVTIPNLNESPETGLNIVGKSKQVVDRYYAGDMRFVGNG